MTKIITYECTQCGCEITVNETHESRLMPIYCCGVEVSKVPPSRKKAKPPQKKTVKAIPKKTAKKIAAKKYGSKTSQKKGSVGKKTAKR